MPPRIYLIRHAPPVVDPSRPSRDWELGEEGTRLARRLADRLAGAGIARFTASDEPKARTTGAVMAAALDVPIDVAAGLGEHARATAPLFASAAEFEAAIRELFARPGERVLGEESADQAHARFAAALGRVLGAAGSSDGAGDIDESIAVVSHGTVMALSLARRSRCDAFALWKSLVMPCCAVLSLPELRLIEVIRSDDDE